MSLNVLIAPDFAPDRFAGWHMLNTLLQKRTGQAIHLLTPASAAEQAQLIADGKADVVYANPFDASVMVREQGFRLWGNRSLSSEPLYAFLSVRRTADMINESILRGHLWAVDRCITATYLEEVQESVREYLRSLKARGAILGGDVWVDPELNTPTSIASGNVVFDFEFTPPYPAERVTFRSHLVNSYVVDLFA